MKIGIMADSHLGMTRFRKSSGFVNKMTLLNNEAFEEAFDILNEQNVDSVIHAGDLFDHPEPDLYSIVHANKILDKNSNLPISIISGNHDYSQKAQINGFHAFDVLNKRDNLDLYIQSVDFKEYEDEKVIIAFVPYKSLGENKADTFEAIYRKLLTVKDYFKILVFHGSIDYDNDEFNDEYDMPIDIADQFDFVTMGHVHYPKTVRQARNILEGGSLVSKDAFHLTPGSLLPSTKATEHTQRPSVYILDTETNTITSFEIKSAPYVFDMENVEDINEALKIISESSKLGIYRISYSGKMSDIDDFWYMKAIENSINISIQASDAIDIAEVSKVKDFWSFVSDKYPSYETEFREVLEEQ